MEKRKPIWVKVLTIITLQLLLGLFIFDSYPVISMLFLGEGGDSLLYSKGNSIVWMLSPIISPTLLNSYRIYNAFNSQESTAFKTYILIQTVVLTTYVAFIIWWALNRSFHI